MMRRIRMEQVEGEQRAGTTDQAAVEEPLGIRIEYWYKDARRTESLALTMRTPGNDRELVAGFLYSEGVIDSREHVREMRALGGEESNEVLVELRAGVDVEVWRTARATILNSSCGVCGKRNLEALNGMPRVLDEFRVEAGVIHGLPEALRERQRGFVQTGGLHAAALAADSGEILAVFEDIGRHNALDKLIGSRVLAGEIPLAQHILFLSSRSSFELVQKAARAGVPVLATVGSPSTLAIEAAEQSGLTLIGFVREQRFNIYSGFGRVHS